MSTGKIAKKSVKNIILWDVTACSPIHHRRFGGKYFLLLQCRKEIRKQKRKQNSECKMEVVIGIEK
jgi:hypothetical protein